MYISKVRGTWKTSFSVKDKEWNRVYKYYFKVDSERDRGQSFVANESGDDSTVNSPEPQHQKSEDEPQQHLGPTYIFFFNYLV